VWHSAKRYVDSGDLKQIAGAGLDPLPDADNKPTIAATFPAFNVIAFNAAVGPAGIPEPVLREAIGGYQRRCRFARVRAAGRQSRH